MDGMVLILTTLPTHNSVEIDSGAELSTPGWGSTRRILLLVLNFFPKLLLKCITLNYAKYSFYLWAEKGSHALTPGLNTFHIGCYNLTSYVRPLYWLRDSAVAENGKGNAWEMRINGENTPWAVKENWSR